jgi:UDP-glucose 4-epimerase
MFFLKIWLFRGMPPQHYPSKVRKMTQNVYPHTKQSKQQIVYELSKENQLKYYQVYYFYSEMQGF